MKKINNLINIFYKVIPGGVFGLTSVLLAFVFVALSYINFPGYNMMENDVSVLGIGPGLSAPLFNTGLKIAGFTAIPFFIYLGIILKKENHDFKTIKRATLLSILGCVSLSLIGFFPVINLTMGIIHAGLALVFFISSIINLILFSRLMFHDERFAKVHPYLGFMTACLIAIYIATRISIIEWVVFFVLGFWMIDISIYTLFKKL
ncbi:MAG: DUF998 domain-containing protein [Candidatus Hermodarchaeota archaeon]